MFPSMRYRSILALLALVALASCASPPAKQTQQSAASQTEGWTTIFARENAEQAATTRAAQMTAYRAAVIDPLAAAIDSTTDPIEFARLRERAIREIHAAPPCPVASSPEWASCYEEVRALETKWLGRRAAVAKANKRCARHVDAIVARNLEGLIGAPVECVYIAEGLPDDVNRTAFANSTHDQLVYGRGRYVYSDNGIITSVQY
jgi:hypothetical protein